MPRVAKKPQPARSVRRNFVADYRKRAGYKNQQALGEAIGRGQTTVSRIERHEIPMTADVAAAIAQACGLTNPDLLYTAPDRPDLTALSAGLPDWEIDDLAAIIEMRKRRHEAI